MKHGGKYEPLVTLFRLYHRSRYLMAQLENGASTESTESGERKRRMDIPKEEEMRREVDRGGEEEGVERCSKGWSGRGLSSEWSAGNQILFISLRAELLFNDGVGITLWLARRWKTLYGLSCGQKERGRGKTRAVQVTRIDAYLATRIHVYVYIERLRIKKGGKRGKSEA